MMKHAVFEFAQQWALPLKLLLICLPLLCFNAVAAADNLTRENKLKAAFLFNFTKYIEWPSEQFTDASKSISLCTDASKDFIVFARALVAERRVGKYARPVTISSVQDAVQCHMVYLQNTSVPAPAQENSVIVRDGVSPGTAILFYRDGRKLRFEIDLAVIDALNITVSSELLKLARVR